MRNNLKDLVLIWIGLRLYGAELCIYPHYINRLAATLITADDERE